MLHWTTACFSACWRNSFIREIDNIQECTRHQSSGEEEKSRYGAEVDWEQMWNCFFTISRFYVCELYKPETNNITSVLSEIETIDDGIVFFDEIQTYKSDNLSKWNVTDDARRHSPLRTFFMSTHIICFLTYSKRENVNIRSMLQNKYLISVYKPDSLSL